MRLASPEFGLVTTTDPAHDLYAVYIRSKHVGESSLMERRIQVAFQGGGARVVHLLAAVDGLQSFERDGFMRVTRAAGTSAGSIAAAVLAANVDAAHFTKTFIAKSEETILSLRNSDPVDLTILNNIATPQVDKWWIPGFAVEAAWRYAKSEANRVLQESYSDLLRILEGKPLFRSAVLATELRRLIEESERIPSSHDKELIIMASNLISAKSEPFSFARFRGNEDKIFEAIIHSCAIPFAFRTPRDLDITGYVDGGLCENLPCDILHDETMDAGEHGEVLAIGFRGEKKFDVANDVRSYLALLFETSINNSMLRAKSRLKPDAIYEIQPRLKTLDFTDMEKHGPGSDSYERTKLEVQIWLDRYISGFATSDKVIYHIPTKTQSLAVEMTEKIGKIYEAQRGSEDYEITKYRTIVVGYSMSSGIRNPTRPKSAPAENDRVRSELECTLQSERLYCIAVAFEGGGPDSVQGPVHVKVTWPDGTEIPVVVLTGKTKKGLLDWEQKGLIFFTPPLERKSEGETRFIVATERRQFALDQATKGWDAAIIYADERAILSTETVLFLPPGAGEWAASCSRKFDRVLGVDLVGVEGQIMTQAEISVFDPYNPGNWAGYGLKTGRLGRGEAAILEIHRKGVLT